MESLQDVFYKFEREFYELKIKEENCWHLFRMQVWQEIESYVRDANNPVSNHPDLDIQRKRNSEKAFMALSMIPNVILSNPLFSLNKKNPILCMGRYRVSKVDGTWINRELNTVFSAFSGKINYIEKASFENKELYSTPKSSAKTDIFEIKRLINELTKKYRFDKDEICMLEKMIVQAEETFNIHMDHNRIITKLQSVGMDTRLTVKLFENLIQKIRPRVVVEICHYNQTNFAVTKIAHKYGIKVIELQHGTIGEKHIAYNYPFKDELTPDYLFTYGKSWITNVRFAGNIVVVGNPYLENCIEKYNTNNKEKNILFISQGPYAKELVKLAVDLANNDEFIGCGYSVMYKLHPSEYLSWKKMHPELTHSNIKVIDSDAISLFDCFSKSTYQIGVNSTAIYEGIAFGLNTLILKHKDVNELFNVIDEKKITIISDAKQVIDIVREGKKTQLVVEDMWESNSTQNMIRELKK